MFSLVDRGGRAYYFAISQEHVNTPSLEPRSCLMVEPGLLA